MPVRGYLNFDLSVETVESGALKVVVTASPAGEARRDLEWPFSEQETEILLLRVGQTRRSVRRIDSPARAAAREFGVKLFDAVFAGDIGTAFERSVDEAERQGLGLRIRLRTDQAPHLADVPWEFLYSTPMHRFLVVSTATPLVRYMEQRRLIAPLRVEEALRILIMVSNPTDVSPLDVEEEWTRVNSSLKDLTDRRLIDVVRLGKATMSELQRELRRHRYHVFHFIGHGALDAATDQGVLMLEDQLGRGQRVSGEHLGAILHDHDSLRLVVLNSCEGARSSQQDPFAGTAQGLVRQGIPAVIGMQFEITDAAAITFSHDFYSAVADGYPVDAALAEARKAIFASGNDVEWGTPVLHMRAPDGRIFEVARSDEVIPAPDTREVTTSARREAPGERARRLNEEAVELDKAGEKDAALEQLEASLAIYRELADHAPSEYRAELAAVLANRATMLIEQGRIEDALVAIDETIDANSGLDGLESRLDLGELLANKAAALSRLDRHADARRVLDEAIVAQRTLMPDAPEFAIPLLTHSFFNRTTLLDLQGLDSQALLSAKEALTELLPYYRARPEMMNEAFFRLLKIYVHASRREGEAMGADLASAARAAGLI